MSKFKHEEQKEKYEFPEYLNEELKELDNLLKEKYNNGNTIDDITHWLQDNGALNKDGEVIVENFRYETNRVGEKYATCDYPSKYELLKDKLDKLNKLDGKKEFAIKKQLEELDKIVNIDSTTLV